MPDEIPPPLRHLANAVRARRRGLGLTREGLHLAGGPSDSTLARIENPYSDSAFPRPSTLDRLDTALQWEAGSAAACLDLREPRPQLGPDATTRAALPATAIGGGADPLDFEHVAVPAEVIREGLDVLQRLAHAANTDAATTRDLTRFARDIGAAHATEVLERFAAAGMAIPGFLLTAFGPFLTENVSDDVTSPSQQRDQAYRRWLAGVTVDDDAQFAARLRAKTRAIGQLDT